MKERKKEMKKKTKEKMKKRKKANALISTNKNGTRP